MTDKDKPVRYVPDIDWSSPDDVERLFKPNDFSAFDGDPTMLGKKLSKLDESLGIFHGRKFSQATVRHNLGQLPPNRFNKLTMEHGDELVDPPLAILMRIYDKYPNLCPPFPYVEMDELIEVGGFNSKRELSLMLGRDQVSATRYSSSDGKKKTPSPTTMILTYVMWLFIKAGKMDEYREIVLQEGKYRGTNNLLSTGFPRVKNKETDVIRDVKTRATKIIKDAKETDAAKEEAQEIVNKCVMYMGHFHELRELRVTLEDNQINYKALVDSDPERAENIKKYIAELESEIAAHEVAESKLGTEIAEASKKLK
ncbi:hypothetical protein [Alteromonas antoniana]|uniref:hypothetical protein n=1 Tax=Alteromonas antoniana TaxID=2803813 RepID=UPI001C47CE8D|nr:hypothetical protein [Alteromonas antoniana]